MLATVVGAAAIPAAAAVPFAGAPACPTMPPDSYWHADVSELPVLPQSDRYVASIGVTAGLKADFGSGTWNGGPIGIPFTTVAGTQPKVPVSFEYADESDPGPYPIPADAPVEGGAASTGDRHVLVVDRDACRLYELFAAYRNGDGSWRAGSGAVFDLRSNAMRPAGWTSADAAGLPILPGLVRYDEVAAGEIDHAIRVTVPRTDRRYVWPARHHAGTANPDLPPMGLWLRLRADYDISGFPGAAQVILRALKRHGAIVADNGSPWYLSGAPDERWDNDVLRTLGQVRGSAFEAVDVSTLTVSPDSGQVRRASTIDTSPYRLAGADRVATALAVSREAFPDGAPAAVMASSVGFADALAATQVAAAANGPVLLTPPDRLDAAVGEELRRLGASTVYLAGGPAALSPTIDGQVAGAVRFDGDDRYETAAIAAHEAVRLWGASTVRDALLVSGVAWADALPAGVLAGRGHRPLLLVSPSEVPDATADALASLGAVRVTVIGGPAVVSDAVASSAGRPWSRLAGADRYATAATVADAAGPSDRVLVATGRTFADALGGGAAAVRLGASLLLTDRDTVSPPTGAWLDARRPAWLRVLGGSAAVSDVVVAALTSRG